MPGQLIDERHGKVVQSTFTVLWRDGAVLLSHRYEDGVFTLHTELPPAMGIALTAALGRTLTVLEKWPSAGPGR